MSEKNIESRNCWLSSFNCYISFSTKFRHAKYFSEKKIQTLFPTLLVASEAVTIGLRQSYYSTVEGEGPVEICISTVSGDFEGSSFSVSYSTTSGQAEGIFIT